MNMKNGIINTRYPKGDLTKEISKAQAAIPNSPNLKLAELGAIDHIKRNSIKLVK